MNEISIPYVAVHQELPVYKHNTGDAGYDLYATEDTWVWPFKVRKIPTNCKVEIPLGFYGEVTGRSGQTTLGNIVATGVIDSTYRGVVHIMIYRIGLLPRLIKKGTRVAQMIFKPYMEANMILVDKLSESNRGDKGFGHSGIQ